MDQFKRNGETKWTKKPYILFHKSAVDCFCSDVNTKKIKIRDNGNDNDKGYTNIDNNSNNNNNDNNNNNNNNNNNSSSNNNRLKAILILIKVIIKVIIRRVTIVKKHQ